MQFYVVGPLDFVVILVIIRCMFVRFNTSPKTKNPIVQVVESYRDNEKVRQRIVASFGAAKSKDDLDRLQALANDFLGKIETERQKRRSSSPLFLAHGFDTTANQTKYGSQPSATLVDPRFLAHRETVFDGFEQVVSALLKTAGFNSILSTVAGRQSFALEDIVKLLLSQMFDDPSSKLRSYQRQEAHGFCGIKLQDLYRGMDKLLPLSEQLQKQAYVACTGTNASLIQEKVSCLFVDVTTLYFESVMRDEIRDFGFSKDQKFHSVQIVLCLAVNDEGIPMGYETFRGNTGEVKTFIPALRKMRTRFNVTSATIVCDRGLASLENVTELDTNGLTFIAATKIKHLPKQLALNDLTTYTSTHADEDESIKYKIVDHPKYPNASLLVTYSARRAKKDKADRDRLLERLIGKLHGKESDPKISKLISNSGYKTFVSTKGDSKWSINEEAVGKAASWDGFHGIAFSKKLELTVADIIKNYRSLWRVEEAFRVAKTNLEIRPMYHWKRDRIQSHVLLCFIGLYCERMLEFRLRRSKTPLTPDRIRYALQSIHTVRLTAGQQEIIVPSQLSADTKAIFKALKLPLRRRTIVNK